jgi:hypothetical protein
MSWSLLLWAGFAGTFVVTWLAFVGRSYGWTRLSPARILGCVFSADPEAFGTRVLGIGVHLMAGGVVLPLLYGALFEWMGRADVLLGACLGLAHAVIAGILLPVVVAYGHCAGPGRDPGLFGWRLSAVTPVAFVLAHALYGALLGYVYVVPRG